MSCQTKSFLCRLRRGCQGGGEGGEVPPANVDEARWTIGQGFPASLPMAPAQRRLVGGGGVEARG